MTSTPAFEPFAGIYDLADLDRSAETGFYRSLVRPTDRAVLELGCGTGTLLLGMAEAPGAQPQDWVGLDESEGMLAAARRRAPHLRWCRGDMRDPPLPGPFDLVVCCFHTLQLVTEPAEVQAMFRRVRALLAPDGRWAFDVYRPNLPYLRAQHPSRVVRRFQGEDGRAMKVVERSLWDEARWTLTTCWDLHPEAAGEDAEPERAMRVPMRQYLAADLERWLSQAGLRVRSRHGGYDGRPLDDTAPKQVFVCGRDDGPV